MDSSQLKSPAGEEVKSFLSRKYTSNSEFTKFYENFIHDSTKFLLLHKYILQELEDRVASGDLVRLKQLAKILEFVNGSKHPSKLVLSDNDMIHISENNAIILACKHGQVEILGYILDRKDPILNYLINYWQMMPSYGEECKTYLSASYHATRSCNIELLNILMSKWPENRFASDPEELDEIISQAYEKLKLNNVHLSSEIETFVEDKLIDLRLHSGTFSKGPNRENFIQYIDERIQLLIDCIIQLNLNEDVDEKFLYIAKNIAQNIHSLKRKLKSTYESLPWEEVEFCVVSFVSACSKKQEMNLFYRSTLDRNRLCQHLEDFAQKLLKEKENILKTDIGYLCTLPKVNRTDNIKKIVESNPEFAGLYTDYQEMRDMHSLDKISRYAKIASSVDATKKEGQIVLVRSLQVLGEHLKNTLESPKLSDFTSELILLTLPANTRKVVINLRNCLSHASSLAERIEIEENSEVNFFVNIQDDVKKIGSTIDFILLSNKTKVIKSLLKQIVDCQTLAELKSIAEIFNNFDYTVGKFSNEMDVTSDRKKLEGLVNQLKSLVTKPSDHQEFFQKMEEVLKKEKGKMSKMRTYYYLATGGAESLMSKFKEYDNADEHDLRDTKYLAEKQLSAMEPEFESQHLKEISELSMKFLDEIILSGEDTNLEKMNRIVCDIFLIVEYEIDDTKSVNEFREKLNKKFNFGFNKYNRNHVLAEKVFDKKLSAKLSDLKNILKGNVPLESSEFLSIKNNGRLVTALEMLILDILSILGSYKNRLQDNLYFLDKNTPLLIGKCLRNHLAHDNNLSDVLLSDPLISLILNARKLATDSESVIGKPTTSKQTKWIKLSTSSFKSKFNRGLETIILKNKMLRAVKAADWETLDECIKGGCDINARDTNGRTALHFACEGGDLEMVKFVVNNKVDLNLKHSTGWTGLHSAAFEGKHEIVEFLIKECRLNVDECDEEKNTPLHFASRYGHLKVVEILLRNGSKMNSQNDMMYLPLHYAVENNHIDIVEQFLKKKVDVQAQLSGGLTPLHIAAGRGHQDLVILLVKHKANIHAIHDRGVIPLHMAVMNGYIKVARFLIEKGSDVNAITTNGLTALHYAVECGYGDLVDLLLSKGAIIDSGNSIQKSSALHSAAFHGHLESVKKLLAHGANAHAPADDGALPIFWATQNGHMEIVKELLKYPVELDDKKRCYVLSTAVSTGNLEMVKLLLEHDTIGGEHVEPPILTLAAKMGKADIAKYLIDKGVYLNADVNDDGLMPIHGAAQEGHLEIVKMIINSGSQNVGAKVDITTLKGETPLLLAAKKGHAEVVDFLIKEGASIDGVIANSGYTPLMVATGFGHSDCVEILAKNNATVNTCGVIGLSPLHLAARNGDLKSVRVLLDHGADIHCVDQWGYTPLSTAIICNQKEAVELLVAEGGVEDVELSQLIERAVKTGDKDIVEIILRDRKFVTNPDRCPLSSAVRYANEDILKILLEKGADINCRETDMKVTALYAAATYGQDRVAKFLIENGADLDARIGDGATALHVSATINNPSVLNLLLANGADTCLKDNRERLPLHVAIVYGRLKSVQILMPYYKHDINARLFEDASLLHLAAEVGFLDVVKYLVDLGADINVHDDLELKPIHRAAQKAHKDVVEFFVNQGMSINIVNSMNQTLLYYADKESHKELVEYLIANGIDIYSKDVLGLTALHVAVAEKNQHSIKILLAKGACIDALDNAGNKPIRFSNDTNIVKILAVTEDFFEAARKNDVSAAKELIEKGAIVNARNVKMLNPLHVAAQNGNEEMVKLLLSNGVDVNSRDIRGRTPLHHATENSHLNTVKSLLTAGAIHDATSHSGERPVDHSPSSDILNILKLIGNAFHKVRHADSKIVKDLSKVKDRSVMKAVMGATNQDGDILISCAEKNKFPRLGLLKKMVSDDDSLLMELGKLLNGTENYDGAIDSFTEVVKTRKNELGPNNPSTLEAELELALALYKKEQYSEAWKKFSSVYQKQKTVLGENHKSTLKTQSYMALLLFRQHKYKESIDIFNDVYPKQKKILKDNDDDLIETESHMASTLVALGKFDEALDLYHKVAEKFKKKHPNDSLHLLSIENNKAMVLMNLGRYGEAAKVYKHVFEERKKKLGMKSQMTWRALHNLAATYEEAGEKEKAMKTFQEILEIQKVHLGPYHPDTFFSKYTVGRLMAMQGKRIGAVQMFTECLGPDKAKLGASHPHVKTAEKFFEKFKMALQLSGELGMLDEVNNFAETLKNAVLNNDMGTVAIFIENGGDLNGRYEDGTTILHWAVKGGNVAIVNMLLKGGAGITHASNKGNTPLHAAVAGNLKELAEVLLKHAVTNQLNDFPNVKTTNSGSTAIHVAAKNGNFDLVQLLLQYGAIYNIKNNSNEKPVDVSDNTSMIKFFNLIDETFTKVRVGKTDVFDSLKSLKPNYLKAIMNARNFDQKTLVQVAVSNNQKEIATRLCGLLKNVK